MTVTPLAAPRARFLNLGHPAQISVQVRAGANEIRFTYRPWGHPWLVILSYTTLCGVLAATLWSLRKRIALTTAGGRTGPA